MRDVKDDGNERGWFMNSQAPYGYLKSPEDKHKFVIDSNVEHIVKGIFRNYADGISAREIACRLTRDEVDCPSYYHYKRTGKNKPRDGSINAWTAETVQKMFRRQVYIGHMVSGTREVASIRTKERQIIDEEDWLIVQNTHDPIIEPELWDAVQEMLPHEGESKAPRVRTLKETGDVSLFAGVLRCSKCGSKLAYIPNKRSYRCSRYNNKGKDVCVGPFISEVAVCDFIMNDIQKYAILSDAERKSLSQRLTSYFHKEWIVNTYLHKKDKVCVLNSMGEV